MISSPGVSVVRLATLGLLGLFVLAGPESSRAGPPRARAPVGALPLGVGLRGWAFCPGRSLVAAALDDRVLVGRLDFAGRRLVPLVTLEGAAWSPSFSADCGLLALAQHPDSLASGAPSTTLWRVAGGEVDRLGSVGTYPLPVSSISLSEDGRWAAVATNGGELVVYWLSPLGWPVRTYEAPPLPKGDQYLRVRLSHGRLLAGAFRGAVRLFTLDPATGRLGPPQELMAPTVATREASSFDPDSGELVLPGGARVFALDFSADGGRAFAVVESGQVFAWDLAPAVGPRVTVIDGFDGPHTMALSPDGKQLALAGSTSAQVWGLDGARATPLATLGGLERFEKYVLVRGLGYAGPGRLVVGTGEPADVCRLLLYAP